LTFDLPSEKINTSKAKGNVLQEGKGRKEHDKKTCRRVGRAVDAFRSD
jgi:hypothetical protein